MMNSQAFGAFLDFDSKSLSNPRPILPKDTISITPAPTPVELDDLAFGIQYHGPEASTYYETTTPLPLVEAQSRPASPHHREVTIIQSWKDPLINKWRVLSCCLVYLANGMSDSAAGALLPYIETQYHIGYAIVSLIFVSQAIGFLGAAFFNDVIKRKLGQAKSYILSEMIMVVAFAIVASTPPYPAVVFAFFLLGWAMAINLALANVFLANLADSTIVLGAAHGAYGVGGTIGPFIATSMVSRGILWSRYYAIILGICAICTVATGYLFWALEKEPSQQLQHALERTASQQARQEKKGQNLILALRNLTTPIGALFLFAYQGAEVSISGWVISFLITERSGDPAKVGYVTAGFWGGITLGRFIVAPLSARYNQKILVHILGINAIACQLLVWFIPNIIGNTVAVALVGFVLGPIAPCTMAYFVRLLPRSIQTTAVSFISSAGSSGGAAAPFITGLLAQAKGTWVLHPVCIALFVIMGVCWFALPSVEKRKD